MRTGDRRQEAPQIITNAVSCACLHCMTAQTHRASEMLRPMTGIIFHPLCVLCTFLVKRIYKNLKVMFYFNRQLSQHLFSPIYMVDIKEEGTSRLYVFGFVSLATKDGFDLAMMHLIGRTFLLSRPQ